MAHDEQNATAVGAPVAPAPIKTWPTLPDVLDPPRIRPVRNLILDLLPRRVLVQRLAPRPTPTVLLTFDDGPHPTVTPAVLDCLDRYSARAVFFLVGRYVRRAPELVREAARRGHLIGNHTLLHLNGGYVTRRPPFQLYLRDVRRCQQEIEKHAGHAPTLFRPPGGRVTPTTLLVPYLLGLRCVCWSLDTLDWRLRRAADARHVATHVLARVVPADIFLFHDNRPTTVDALERILPALRDRGFDLASGLEGL